MLCGISTEHIGVAEAQAALKTDQPLVLVQQVFGVNIVPVVTVCCVQYVCVCVCVCVCGTSAYVVFWPVFVSCHVFLCCFCVLLLVLNVVLCMSLHP